MPDPNEDEVAEDFLIEEEKTLRIHYCPCDYCSMRRSIVAMWRKEKMKAKGAVDMIMIMSQYQADEEGIEEDVVRSEEDVAWDEKSEDDQWRKMAKGWGLDQCL